LVEPQALYWLARAGAFDPAVRGVVIGALGAWRSKLLPSGLVAKTPAAQGSLQSSVIAAELFASLGAIAETPPWLRDVVAKRSPVTTPTSAGPRAAAQPVEAQRRQDETVLVALGCHAIAAACPRATTAAAEILRQPLPAQIRTAGQARQWIMVIDARRRLGIDTSERADVDTSRESWIKRGAVRTRLAATLCEVGQGATAASLGTGEPIEQARRALDAGQLELATALLRLKGARQERVSLADLSPVTSRLGRFRAAGTGAMFSWTPGGPASVAATQAVYDSALALGFSASDLVSAAAAPTISTTTSVGRS
jgi:hypothetical protein